MEALIVMLVLVVLAVPILLVMALVSISGLKRRVGELEEAVHRQQSRAAGESERVAPATAYRPSYAPQAAEEDAPPETVREPTLAELTRTPSVQEPVAPAAPVTPVTPIRQAEVPDPTLASVPAPPPLPPVIPAAPPPRGQLSRHKPPLPPRRMCSLWPRAR